MNEAGERIRRMLRKDKMCLSEGYMRALKGDVNRLLSYYMTPAGECEVVVAPEGDGFSIKIKARAVGLKSVEAV